MKTIFTIFFSLLMFVGCGDVRRDGKTFIYTGPQTTELVSNPETTDGYSPTVKMMFHQDSRAEKDVWTNGTAEKIGSANNVCLAGSIDPEFVSTIWGSNARWLCITQQKQAFKFGSEILAGTTIYIRACYQATNDSQLSVLWLNKNFSHCSGVHEINLDDEDQGQTEYWEDEAYEYRKLKTKILPIRKACAAKEVAGVSICYEWDFQTLVVKNGGTEGLQVKLETEAGKTVFDTTLPLMGGKSENSNVSLEVGDVIVAKVWKDSIEGTADRIKKELPDAQMQFTVKEESLEVVGLMEKSVHTLTLPSAHLVNCVIERTVFGNTLVENSTEEYTDKVVCKNTSTSHVEVALRVLMPNPATTPAGTYVTQGLILDNLDVGEGKTEEVTLNFPIVGGTYYAVEIKTDGWFDNPDLRSVLPFWLSIYGDNEFSIQTIPVSSYYEPE